MKWTIISILCMFVVISASGQQNLSEDFTEAQSPVNIAQEEVNQVFTPPAVSYNNLKSGNLNVGNIEVTYVNFPTEAQKALVTAENQTKLNDAIAKIDSRQPEAPEPVESSEEGSALGA